MLHSSVYFRSFWTSTFRYPITTRPGGQVKTPDREIHRQSRYIFGSRLTNRIAIVVWHRSRDPDNLFWRTGGINIAMKTVQIMGTLIALGLPTLASAVEPPTGPKSGTCKTAVATAAVTCAGMAAANARAVVAPSPVTVVAAGASIAGCVIANRNAASVCAPPPAAPKQSAAVAQPVKSKK